MSLFIRYGEEAGLKKKKQTRNQIKTPHEKQTPWKTLSNFQVRQNTSKNASLLTCFFLPVSELEFCTSSIVEQLICLHVQGRKGRNVALHKNPEGW